MRHRRAAGWLALALSAVLSSGGLSAQGAQAPAKPFEPQVGQAGKDVVWVPTSQALVEKMLDMTKVTPQDYVIDLGSGDGRTVITAAKRGATALGIEYNPEMVDLAKRNAVAQGVAAKATFVKADLFESDFSKATVITMFLLPSINMKLRPQLLNLKPGTRIAANTFTMEDWQPDETATLTNNCESWCTALLWIVPAKVAGTWQTAEGPLTLTQEFQRFKGTLGSATLNEPGLKGDAIEFKVGAAHYTGRVSGNTMQGTITGGSATTWSAKRQ